MGRDYKVKPQHEGLERFSFSKLSTYDHCAYGYYLSYIKHIRGKDSVYGYLGTSAHENSQDLVEGKIDNMEAITRFEESFEEALNILDLRFPTEKSKVNYQECVLDFLENYKPKHDKFEIERGFDILVGNTKTLVWGFIDLIIHNEDNSIDVVDYKTSADFSKKDFITKRMQLLLYAKALKEEGYKINRLYFNMLKYCTIEWEEINSKKQLVQKSTKCERNIIGTKLKATAERLLKKEGIDEIEIEMKIENMISTNVVDELIADRFTISDYKVDVDFGDNNIKEMEEWIDNIVNKIKESEQIEENYECIELNKGSEFFCSMLCNKPCKYFDEYKRNDNNSYKNRKQQNKEIDDDLDDLL